MDFQCPILYAFTPTVWMLLFSQSSLDLSTITRKRRSKNTSSSLSNTACIYICLICKTIVWCYVWIFQRWRWHCGPDFYTWNSDKSSEEVGCENNIIVLALNLKLLIYSRVTRLTGLLLLSCQPEYPNVSIYIPEGVGIGPWSFIIKESRCNQIQCQFLVFFQVQDRALFVRDCSKIHMKWYIYPRCLVFLMLVVTFVLISNTASMSSMIAAISLHLLLMQVCIRSDQTTKNYQFDSVWLNSCFITNANVHAILSSGVHYNHMHMMGQYWICILRGTWNPKCC